MAKAQRARTALSFCVLMLAFGAPMSAAAQFDDTGNETFLSSTSTSTTTSAMTTALVTVIVITVTPGAESERLRSYLEHNAVGVQQALALGGGDCASDLALAFGVTNEQERQAFFSLLNQQREALGETFQDEHITAEETQRFVLVVYEAMKRHEALSHAVARLEGQG